MVTLKMGGNNLFFEEEKIVKIKSKCITFVVAFACAISNFVSVGAAVTAKPTTSKIYVNGEQKCDNLPSMYFIMYDIQLTSSPSYLFR